MALYTVTTDNYVDKLKMCNEVKYTQHYLSEEWKCCAVHCLTYGTNQVLSLVLSPDSHCVSQLLTTSMICDQPYTWYNVAVTKTLLLRTYPDPVDPIPDFSWSIYAKMLLLVSGTGHWLNPTYIIGIVGVFEEPLTLDRNQLGFFRPSQRII